MRLFIALLFVLIYVLAPDPFPGPLDDAIVAFVVTTLGAVGQVRKSLS